MNYEKIYHNLIEKRRKSIPEEYSEIHHIIPRSLGGSDNRENLIKLTAREHFIAHALLSKMYRKGTNEWYKMNHAFLNMFVRSETHPNRYINSRFYAKVKSIWSEIASKSQTGSGNSQYGLKWIHNKKLRICKKIPKNEALELGWEPGAIFDFDRYEAKEKAIRAKERQKRHAKIKDAIGTFKEFINGDFSSINDYSKRGNYPFSHVSLHHMWENYLPFMKKITRQGKSLSSQEARNYFRKNGAGYRNCPDN